jgi:hypothetical protein
VADLSREGLVRIAAEAREAHAITHLGERCTCGLALNGPGTLHFFEHTTKAIVDALLAAIAGDAEANCGDCACDYADRLRALIGESQR